MQVRETNTNYTGYKIVDNDGLQWSIYKSNTADPYFAIGRYTDGVWQANPFIVGYSGITSLMDGNVGIGTVTPTQKLHVEGNINVTGTLYSNSSGIVIGNTTLNNVGGNLTWNGQTVATSQGTVTGGLSCQTKYSALSCSAGAPCYSQACDAGYIVTGCGIDGQDATSYYVTDVYPYSNTQCRCLSFVTGYYCVARCCGVI